MITVSDYSTPIQWKLDNLICLVARCPGVPVSQLPVTLAYCCGVICSLFSLYRPCWDAEVYRYEVEISIPRIQVVIDKLHPMSDPVCSKTYMLWARKGDLHHVKCVSIFSNSALLMYFIYHAHHVASGLLLHSSTIDPLKFLRGFYFAQS